MALIVSGIEIEVNKSNVKNLRLYVKPPDGKVTVSAPLTMPYYEIEQFVRSKESWIKTNLAKIKNQSLKSKDECKTGCDFFVWGKKYELQIQHGKKNSIKLQGTKAIFTIVKGNTASKREKFVCDWYKKQLIKEIEVYLPKWEKKTKLICESWNTRYMTSRWGSCKPKSRKLCFNIQLAKKPLICLEYIILHELVHFEERFHNERFYSLVSKFMPKWKEIKKLLKDGDEGSRTPVPIREA